MKNNPYRGGDLTPKSPLALSLVLSMLLLPLSAVAVDSDTKSEAATTTPAASQNIEDAAPQTKNEPTVTGDSAKNNADNLDNLKTDTATKPLITDTSEPLANNSQMTSSDLSSNSANLQETAISPTPTADSIATPQATPAPENTVFGLPLDYILAGIMVLLALGLGFLFSRIHALAHENHNLTQNLSKLAAQVNSNNKSLKQLKEEDLKIRQELRQISIAQSSKLHEPNQLDSTVLPLSIDDKPMIADLDLADRKQLADIFTKWLTTNRGKNKIEEVIPADIGQKLKHWHYSIQFWAQGDGVDDVKPTKNQMYVSVISLTKPDQQGIAYCYNKPNSLSTLWKNQSWYEVQHIGQTLNVSRTPLETV